MEAVADHAARAGVRASAGLVAWVLGTGLAGPAWAQKFQAAPKASESGGGAGDPEMILGLVSYNTLFFIAVGVIAFYWFLFGGGRRARLGRKE